MAHHHPVGRSVLRAAQQEAELPWLFCQSDGEVSGLKASHGALVEMAQTGAARAGAGTAGIPRRVQGITARQADAADRQRRLRQRLEQLSPRQQEVLWLAYGPKEWGLPADERKRLGAPWHGVALVTLAAAKGWAAERRARGERVGEQDARALVETGRQEGEPLTAWRQGEDRRADVATWYAKGLGHWLRGPAVDSRLLAAVRTEAEGLVVEAWMAWDQTEVERGRRRPEWRGEREDGDRISETRLIAYRPSAPTAPLQATRARRLGS